MLPDILLREDVGRIRQARTAASWGEGGEEALEVLLEMCCGCVFCVAHMSGKPQNYDLCLAPLTKSTVAR